MTKWLNTGCVWPAVFSSRVLLQTAGWEAAGEDFPRPERSAGSWTLEPRSHAVGGRCLQNSRKKSVAYENVAFSARMLYTCLAVGSIVAVRVVCTKHHWLVIVVGIPVGRFLDRCRVRCDRKEEEKGSCHKTHIVRTHVVVGIRDKSVGRRNKVEHISMLHWGNLH